MPFTTIKKPSDYFNTKLYAGNSGTQSITGVGFQPDFLWIKRRNLAGDHNLVDVIRTSDKTLISNSNGAEYSNSTITSFDSDGFSLSGSDGALNASSNDYASWNWLAGNSAGSANTDGSISSTVSANTTSGFSIVTFTGNSGTVGHGLGVKPAMIVVKSRQSVNNWVVMHKGLTGGMSTNVIVLNTTAAEGGGGAGMAEPTSSVFTITSGLAANDNNIAYCFAEKTGYSKFGSYVGNGNADGTFVYTGFKPAWILIKHASGGTAVGESWNLQDVKRSTYNSSIISLFPNTTDADNSTTNNSLDILSNGFKVRTVDNRLNNSGASYIYMAFAEEPLVGDNPATAR